MWTYNGCVFCEDDICDYYGFVYCITNKKTHKQYIGRKYFYKIRNGVTSYSDWETYTGSSIDLNNDINIIGEDQFDFTILELYQNKEDVVIREMELQLERDVLNVVDDDGCKLYYNKAISNKYFELDDNAKYKISCALRGKSKSDECKRKISESLKGNIPWNKGMTRSMDNRICSIKSPKSDDCKKKISKSLKGNINAKGSIRTEEYKSQMSDIMKIKSNFVTNNPNTCWSATLCVGDEIIVVDDISKYCLEHDIKYNALRVWSKKNLNTNRLHPKYNMKILKLNKI